MKKIILLSAKAQHGKNLSADLMSDILEKEDERIIQIAYADYVKHIAIKYFGWNGRKDKIGRGILQKVGTELGRRRVSNNIWVDRVIEDIIIFKDEFDYVFITDCRFPNEIDRIYDYFPKEQITSIRINRPNFDNGLTDEQKNHPSETALDNYEDFDYIITNDKDVSHLSKALDEVLEDIKS